MSALAAGCAAHQADTTAAGASGTVSVTTNIAAVRDCRVIRHVDSRDTSLGCGPNAPSTPEECLRYQVRLVGGDTLLMRGPAGEAYDCGRAEPHAVQAQKPMPAPAAAEQPSAPALATPAPAVVPGPTPAPAAVAPAPEVVAAAIAPAAVADPLPPVRATTDRSTARGCVYLGEVDWTAACRESGGTVVGPCAEAVKKLAGNLVVREGARAEAFWCRPTP